MTCFVGPWYITWLNDPALYFFTESIPSPVPGMSRLYLEREQLAQIIKAELHHHHSHCRSIAQSTERIVEKIYETAEKKPSKKRKSGKSGWDAWKKKKLRTQQSLVSICAMLCWDPWPCLGHVRIVNQSGAGWNNIGVGRNHKEGNHGIPWQNISLCFYWDLGTSWQAGGNSSWTRAVRTSRGLDCSQEGDRFVGSVVVSTSNRHRKNVLSRIEQLNIAGRAMKVQWKFNGSLRTFSTFLCGNTCFMIR